MSEAVASYLAGSEACDIEQILDALAPGAELLSPLAGSMRFSGREDLRTLLSAVYGTISDLRWEPPVGDGSTRVAVGTFKIGGLQASDAMVFDLDADGRIVRIRPHIRPWLGLTAFALLLLPKLAPHPGLVLRAVRGRGGT